VRVLWCFYCTATHTLLLAVPSQHAALLERVYTILKTVQIAVAHSHDATVTGSQRTLLASVTERFTSRKP
jgi:hypothetical protein